VIATRYHTLVAALMCGRPAVSVGYTPKNSEVMKQFGLGQYCQNIGDFDPAIIRRHYLEVTAEPEKLGPRLLETRRKLQDLVHAHFASVAARIVRRKRPD
jgi:polysaccharide pyruvyl transferase WcaK-like protein